jgi:AcrR family transcriptional regulator
MILPCPHLELCLEDMLDTSHSPHIALIAPDMARLMDSCRKLVAEGGLRNLSLRSAAKASGWTMGEINYRIGPKQQLIATLLEHERDQTRMTEKRWHASLAGVDQISPDLLATIVAGYLDDLSTRRRESAIFWHDILLEAGVDKTLRAPISSWIDEREAFWHSLLEGKFPNYELMAPLIASYISSEKIYSVALAEEPSYRLIRMACIKRLCSRIASDPSCEWNGLFAAFDNIAPSDITSLVLSRQAETVATAAGRLILDQGVSAVTHRAVAQALNQTASAVSHHFKTGVDLIGAGFQLLYDDIQRELKAFRSATNPADAPSPPEAMRKSTAPGITFVRAMHLIALASVRDPRFIPLTLRERAVRGRLIAAWFGEDVVDSAQFDRVALQVISMSMGGRTLHAIARGEPLAGNSTTDLFSIFGH